MKRFDLSRKIKFTLTLPFWLDRPSTTAIHLWLIHAGRTISACNLCCHMPVNYNVNLLIITEPQKALHNHCDCGTSQFLMKITCDPTIPSETIAQPHKALQKLTMPC